MGIVLDAAPPVWEQQPGEPDQAFRRFVVYRDLGPGRSVALAYRVLDGHAKATKASGAWSIDSAKWDWVNRAKKYDLAMLREHGQELVVAWMGVLLSVVKKAATKLADPDCVPKDFNEAMAVIDKLAVYLTPDAIRQVQSGTGDSVEPQEPAVRQLEPITADSVE